MAARAIWSGSISFGLVNIPVKLYTAVSPKNVRFHLLHDADGARVRQKRFCSAEDVEIDSEHIIKGYEVAKNRYIPVMPEELEALDPKATHTIDIVDFVPAAQIDPMYFDRPYYLAPDRGAQKAYVLLRTAMEASQRIAIARVVMRTKQYVTALRPLKNALCASTLFYADEVVSEDAIEGIPTEEMELTKRELGMAEQLIETLSTDFDPENYHDEYRERVLELVERKAEGQEVVAPPEAPGPPKVLDLMAALEASLAKTRQEESASKKEEGKKRA